jgi:hypothetical protein
MTTDADVPYHIEPSVGQKLPTRLYVFDLARFPEGMGTDIVLGLKLQISRDILQIPCCNRV